LCIVLVFLSMYGEIKYRPGNSGFYKSLKSFESNLKTNNV